MMFRSAFHAGIRDGSITRTYRYWKRPQARIGSFQKVNPIGRIEITDIRKVSVSSIRKADAVISGFASAKDLLKYIDAFATAGRDLYRVDFRFVGSQPGLDPDTGPADTEEALDAIDRALALRDRNSRSGSWTQRTLTLVAEAPGLSSARMAEELGRAQAALKQDMRKLKKLGLTISLETGYKLSPRGESWVRARGIMPR